MSNNIQKDYFESILEAILLIEERSVAIKKAEDFVLSSNGTMVLDSIAMRLQVIGELIKKIEKTDPNILEKYPQVQWPMIMRLRDIISHHYDIIDHEIIFDISKKHLPDLKKIVSRIIQEQA